MWAMSARIGHSPSMIPATSRRRMNCADAGREPNRFSTTEVIRSSARGRWTRERAGPVKAGAPPPTLHNPHRSPSRRRTTSTKDLRKTGLDVALAQCEGDGVRAVAQLEAGGDAVQHVLDG